MSDDLDDGGCCGCLLIILAALVGIGLIGLAWHFVVWCWTWK
jgi:hypothetical protein